MINSFIYLMRTCIRVLLLMSSLAGCDTQRLYEQNVDLERSQWPMEYKPAFEFKIRDTGKQYSLLCNIRNSSTYPYARFFFNYSLKDTTGAVLASNMASVILFDPKSGKPNGAGGIGDVFDHRVTLLPNYQFKYMGRYTIEFEQNMRVDTLSGIEAVGLRIEQALPEEKKHAP